MLGAGFSWLMRGKAPPEMPAFQPYRGKPAVRNDREGRGNDGIIRSPGSRLDPTRLRVSFLPPLLCIARGHRKPAPPPPVLTGASVATVSGVFLLGRKRFREYKKVFRDPGARSATWSFLLHWIGSDPGFPLDTAAGTLALALLSSSASDGTGN
jgi:hypothetical protein